MLPSVASLLTATALHARVRIFLDPPYPPSLSTLPLSPQYFIYLPLHHALLRFSSTVHSAQTVQSYSTVITFIKISKLLHIRYGLYSQSFICCIYHSIRSLLGNIPVCSPNLHFQLFYIRLNSIFDMYESQHHRCFKLRFYKWHHHIFYQLDMVESNFNLL